MVLLGAPPETATPGGRNGVRATRVIGVGAALVVVLLVVRAVLGSSSHSYEFIAMQGDRPVTWDHCHAIRYSVNPKGGPDNWAEIVHDAVADIEKASGFVFADLGTTVKTHLIGQGQYAGNEWEPVLITWSDRLQDQTLDGNVVGHGGSAPIDVNGTKRYVIGDVTLDANEKDPFATRMVLEHELGHVLGLDHTSDPSQL